MRVWQWISCGLGILGIAAVKPTPQTEWSIVISGDIKGYLSPCGCSDPMTGGIKRRATAIESLRRKSSLLIVDNGGLIEKGTRQDEIKAESLAEAFGMLGADAINLVPSEAKLGKALLTSIQRLSGDKLISTHFNGTTALPIKAFIAKGPYLVGGVCNDPSLLAATLEAKALTRDEAIKRLVDEATKRKLKPILLLKGSYDDATLVAKKNPKLILIVYSAGGDPLPAPTIQSKTTLITPGEFGKSVVVYRPNEKQADAYRVIPLNPEFKDDPGISAIYQSYLSRVDDEKLLEQLPRTDTASYAGAETCKRCHGRSYSVWSTSAHATALDSLEKVGHERDPDCVSCHVVGLNSKQGFKSRSETPGLASVQCESCHGPLADHAQSPRRVRPSRRQISCTSCHDTGHSTHFDRDAYWQKIAHH